MFYGLASGAVETNGLRDRSGSAHIETLNRAAFEGRYEVTALSPSTRTRILQIGTRSCRTAPAWVIGYGPIVAPRPRRPPFDDQGDPTAGNPG